MPAATDIESLKGDHNFDATVVEILLSQNPDKFKGWTKDRILREVEKIIDPDMIPPITGEGVQGNE